MPELPEVEVLRRHLEPLLLGRRVAGVRVLRPKAVRPGTGEELAALLQGTRFGKVGRRGKYLVFELSAREGARRVLGHLGMTGRMYLRATSGPVPKHAAVVLPLDGGKESFVFEDPRGFGRFSTDLGPLDELGPEPWDRGLDAGGFGRALAGTGRAIKVVLLDQSVIAGVGNIYASEALFRAGIAPARPANRLKPAEATRLLAAIRTVLDEAIALGTKAPLDFAGGEDGLFYYGSGGDASVEMERFRVYDRAGEPCPECGGPIRRVALGGRGTFWCPKCQR
ncbi:MAG: bifunctional DNA-formamidopyrimidine glycosylase/DNA-(apurinic or apyrimidinic site) lyase [Verrucomicrobia bacterium]|nr:MAG: bifunctional DNA-formamidopyrimidine glycosylase/DNA-(apurinic or apyrimidinic site) lyase [Verrucomicrobiota bacterium]